MSSRPRSRAAANLSWPDEGGVALFAMLVGGVQFNPSVMGIAGAAVLGGIVAVGSNRSTAKEGNGETPRNVDASGGVDP